MRTALASVLACALALTACTVGEPADRPGADPTASSGSAGTDLEATLDRGGLTDEDVGFPRSPDSPDAYGLDAPTQDMCDPPDATDQRRVARVQHRWESPGWTTGAAPVVALSTELVVYEPGGGEAAMSALTATPETCPTRELDDGSTVAFEGADPPPSALPGSRALRVAVVRSDGTELQQVIVGQRVGDLVGYLYVTGFDATVTTEAARLSAVLAMRLTALAGQVVAGPEA